MKNVTLLFKFISAPLIFSGVYVLFFFVAFMVVNIHQASGVTLPTGTIILIPSAPVFAAGGDVAITSSVVRYSDGQPVLDGEVFTVSCDIGTVTGLGGGTGTTELLVTTGTEVLNSGIFAFLYQAPSAPGIATITVSSYYGDASGSREIRIINSLIYVNDDATGADNGSSWVDAFTSLQSALTAAVSGDEIWVGEGIYVPGTARTDSFQLKSGVALYGGFNGTESLRDERDWTAHDTTLSGDVNGDDDGFTNNGENVYNVVKGANNATIDGFTISAGNASGDGGGMYNSSSSPMVNNCTFSGNNANNWGGGMYNSSSSPALTNCTFSGNNANWGGGMFSNSSSPTLTNCTFSQNSANYGGGMYNYASSSTVTNCTFSGNSANWGGAGMLNYNYSSPTVTNCTFSGNNATHWGGGMYNDANSSPAVSNCTFSGNNANTYGGGMYNAGNSSPAVNNCVFSDNNANTYGGGMYSRSSSPTVSNCIFSDNSSSSGGGMYNYYNSFPGMTNCIFLGDSPNEIYNDSSTPSFLNCDIQGSGGSGSNWDSSLGVDSGGNIDADPLFIGNGDYHLKTASPCIDAGTASGAPDTDIDGESRPQGLYYDIGVDEFSGILPAEVVGQATTTVTGPSSGVAGATITIVEISQSALTDTDGNYVLGGLPAGTYTLTIEKVPFATITINNIVVLEGQRTTVPASEMTVTAEYTQAELDQAVADAEAAKEAIITQKDTEIANLNTTVADLNITVSDLNTVIATKDQTITDLNATVAAKDTEIADQKATIANYDVNGDGKIGLEEAIRALQIVVGTLTNCSANTDCSEPFYCSKPVGGCAGQGYCVPKPEVCIQVYDPACGCDGNSYGNACEAATAGINVASEGECVANE